MSDLIERVARAICQCQGEKQFWQDFEPQARAAIKVVLNEAITPTVQDMIDQALLSDTHTKRLLLRRPLTGEITEEMAKAGADAWLEVHREESGDAVFEAVYRAMLAVHPSGPTKKGGM